MLYFFQYLMGGVTFSWNNSVVSGIKGVNEPLMMKSYAWLEVQGEVIYWLVRGKKCNVVIPLIRILWCIGLYPCPCTIGVGGVMWEVREVPGRQQLSQVWPQGGRD